MYALLVASERIARWLDCIKQQKPGYAAEAVVLATTCQIALPPAPSPTLLVGAACSWLIGFGARVTLDVRHRRWRTAVRELRKAVEAEHAYAEEVGR